MCFFVLFSASGRHSIPKAHSNRKRICWNTDLHKNPVLNLFTSTISISLTSVIVQNIAPEAGFQLSPMGSVGPQSECNAGQLLGLALEGLNIPSSQLAANKFHAPINRISPAMWGHLFRMGLKHQPGKCPITPGL